MGLDTRPHNYYASLCAPLSGCAIKSKSDCFENYEGGFMWVPALAGNGWFSIRTGPEALLQAAKARPHK